MAAADYDQRKQLFEDLKGLTKSEYEEIFRIIRKASVPYTENSNGIFFDLNCVGSEVVSEIRKYLTMCAEMNTEQTQREKEMEDLRGPA